jgi:hypothetical protein
MKTKNIVWEWKNTQIMKWPRDCDLMPGSNNYLVTDADKTFVLYKEIGETGISINYGGFEADYIEESDTIIIGGDTGGKVREYDADTGKEIWQWGNWSLKQLVAANLLILILFELYWCIIIIYRKKRLIYLLPLLVLIGIEVFFILGFEMINTFFFVRMIC